MRVVQGRNLSYLRGVTRLAPTEPTEYIDCNFSQKHPHTALFDVPAGLPLVFINCNLINVTVPEGAVIGRDSTNYQIETIPTANDWRPTLNLPCECDKCVTFMAAVRAEVAAGEWQKHRRLDLVKAKARERRKDPAVLAADRAVVEKENMDACIHFIPQLSEPDLKPAEVLVVEETAPVETKGWFASLLERARKALGF